MREALRDYKVVAGKDIAVGDSYDKVNNKTGSLMMTISLLLMMILKVSIILNVVVEQNKAS